MRRQPVKNHSFLSLFLVFLITLLLAGFVWLGISLLGYETAVTRSWLVQRIAPELPQRLKKMIDEKSLEESVENDKGQLRDQENSRLRLLLEGGIYAGRRLPPVSEPELKSLLMALLNPARGLKREEKRPQSIPDSRGFQMRHLSAALILQAAHYARRSWLIFGFLSFLLVLLFLTGFFLFRACRQCQDDFSSRFQLGRLQIELLRKWPEALFLIDKKFALKIVNRKAEKYFGCLSGERNKVYFDRFCREKELLAALRKTFAGMGTPAVERLMIEPEKFLLQAEADSGEKPFEVVVEWYALTLEGEVYILGRLYDSGSSLPELSGGFASRYLQELTEKFFTVQDEERRLLADELHDGLCQALAVLRMQVAGIERQIGDGELKEECINVRRYTAQIIEDVRRLSHDLSPVILDDLGLSEALVHLVNNFTSSHDIKVVTSVPPIDEYFTESQARNIYRIVQEAINNVGKHAQASSMSLEIEIEKEKICFLIRDDGVGFESEELKIEPDRAGIGLASMAQRVALLQGSFKITSQPGQGAEIRFSLPKQVRASNE